MDFSKGFIRSLGLGLGLIGIIFSVSGYAKKSPYSGSTDSSYSKRSSFESTGNTSSYSFGGSGGALNEVSASFTNGRFDSYSYSGVSVSNLNLTVDYRRMIMKGLQVGGIIEMRTWTVGKSSSSCTGIWGTVTYNFVDSWNNSDAYFAGANLGMACVSGDTKTKFSWALEGGKHFPLFDKIQYTPKGGLEKIGDADMGFFAVPLNITMMF